MHLEFAQSSTVQFLLSPSPYVPEDSQILPPLQYQKVFINLFYCPAIKCIFSFYSSAQMFCRFLLL